MSVPVTREVAQEFSPSTYSFRNRYYFVIYCVRLATVKSSVKERLRVQYFPKHDGEYRRRLTVNIPTDYVEHQMIIGVAPSTRNRLITGKRPPDNSE
jgi:hypothetical protein